MRKAVRAIVINGENLLVMHRNKFGAEYYTLPGGNIEVGEDPLQALTRELFEETQLKVEAPRLVIIEHAGNPYGDQYIFLCRYTGGEPVLMPGSEEDLINKIGKNLYTPGWLNLSGLNDVKFVSEKLKSEILAMQDKGWPETVVEI
jgi:8-oxo-dGTP diphosphatase